MSKHLRSEHLRYLKGKGPFRIDCSTSIFSREEVAILEKFGHWFAGLTSNKLSPITYRQERFVTVARSEAAPESVMERAWHKYLGRKKIESENPASLRLNYLYEDEGFYTREGYYKLHPQRKGRV
jgi:uncharacterized protein